MTVANLLVIAKEPVPGRVKTRLTPGYTARQAAALAEAALADTLALAVAIPARRHVLVLAGEPGDWLPAGVEVLPQHGDGLDDRIANAFDAVDGPTLLIGMDTPQLRAEQLSGVLAADAWRRHDAWFGPAADGGFWALALARPDGGLVRGVPMSRADTGARQLDRLTAAGLRVGRLPVLRDVDTPDDVLAAARLVPTGRFAATLARLENRPA